MAQVLESRHATGAEGCTVRMNSLIGMRVGEMEKKKDAHQQQLASLLEKFETFDVTTTAASRHLNFSHISH